MIDPNLQQLKDKFISDLKILLENKTGLSAKKLQSEAEKLFNKFNDNVNKYRKEKIKELEKKVSDKENQTIQDLDNQLNEI